MRCNGKNCRNSRRVGRASGERTRLACCPATRRIWMTSSVAKVRERVRSPNLQIVQIAYRRFRSRQRLRRDPAPFRARRRTDQPPTDRSGGASSAAAARDQWRAICHAARPRSARCFHLHPRAHASRCRGQIALTQNAERHLKSDAEMRALFRDRPDAIDEHRCAWPSASSFRSKISATNFPITRCRTGTTMDSFLRTITLFGAQQRYAAISSAVKRQARRRTGAHREARVLRLFFDRLGHRQFLPRKQHHGAGPRQRGEQRGLLLPRHHAGRSGEQSISLRTFPQRRPQRLAGHRSRSAERRSARDASSRKFTGVTANTARP